jgi:hypothetical protein
MDGHVKRWVASSLVRTCGLAAFFCYRLKDEPMYAS